MSEAKRIRTPLRQKIFVRAFEVDGDQFVMVRRRWRRGADAKKRTNLSVLHNGGMFIAAEELEVFAAMGNLLTGIPGEASMVYLERPTSAKLWLTVKGGIRLSSGADSVNRVLAMSRTPMLKAQLLAGPSDKDQWDRWADEEEARRLVATLCPTPIEKWAESAVVAYRRIEVPVPGPGSPSAPKMNVCSCGKAQFDQVGANMALFRIRSQRHEDGKKPARVYRCPTSDAWHLTSKGKKLRIVSKRA